MTNKALIMTRDKWLREKLAAVSTAFEKGEKDIGCFL
jgi:hypothetical protein